MSLTGPAPPPDPCPMAQMRRRIVDAAKARFHHYGLGKTTMAEIAADLGMSPGNLYRYYPGKLDIAAEIARESFAEMNVALREILRKPAGNAVEKLHELMFAQLRMTWNKIEMSPKVMEMATAISNDRIEILNESLHATRAILAECLAQGNASGEFNIPDVVIAAEMLQTATHIFRYPQLWTKLTLDRLERELDGVLMLIVQGLKCRTSGAGPAVSAAA